MTWFLKADLELVGFNIFRSRNIDVNVVHLCICVHMFVCGVYIYILTLSTGRAWGQQFPNSNKPGWSLALGF